MGTVAEFGRTSPTLFRHHLKAVSKRMARERRESVMLAYNIGAFVGFSKLPPWSQIENKLGAAEPQRDMTDEEMMHAMDLHIAALRAAGMQPAAH